MKQKLLKKFELLLVVMAYIALGIFFLLVAYIAINYVKGKRFDWDNKSWVPNGMVIFASRPSNGNLHINGKLTKHRSGSSVFPRKLNIFSPGIHEVRVTKEGYRDWVKTFDIKDSSLHWAHYIWLIKEDINYKDAFNDINVFDAYQYGESSKIVIAVQENENDISYFLTDLSDKKKRSQLSLGENEKISTITWSKSGNKLLARVLGENENIYYRVYQGKNLEDIIDITDIFRVDFDGTDIAWSIGNESELYFLNDKNLLKLNFDDKFITAPLFNNVINYHIVDKDRIIVARLDDEAQEVNLLRVDANGNNNKLLFSALPSSDNYEIECTQSCERMSILVGKNGYLKVITNIKGKLNSQKLAENIKFASWSGDGKKILYGNKSKIYVYDYEKDLEYLIFEGKSPVADWYPDSHHIIVRESDKAILIDYDGDNKVTLAKQVTGLFFFQYDFSNFYYFSNDKLINFRVD